MSNRSGFATGQLIFEFRFARESNRLCSPSLQQRKIDVVRGGKNGHSERIIDFRNHGLCQLLPRYVSERCDPLSGVGSLVRDGHVLNVLTIEKLFQFLYRHGRTPSLRRNHTSHKSRGDPPRGFSHVFTNVCGVLELEFLKRCGRELFVRYGSRILRGVEGKGAQGAPVLGI